MYERLQIESLLRSDTIQRVPGVGLCLMTEDKNCQRVFDIAILPAMQKNGLNVIEPVTVFNSSSNLAVATRWLQEAEVIVADLGILSGDLLYILGLAHGLGRCPLLLTQNANALPFNLGALRWLEYRPDLSDLKDLRDHLTRAIRVFLLASKSRPSGDASQ